MVVHLDLRGLRPVEIGVQIDDRRLRRHGSDLAGLLAKLCSARRALLRLRIRKHQTHQQKQQHEQDEQREAHADQLYGVLFLSLHGIHYSAVRLKIPVIFTYTEIPAFRCNPGSNRAIIRV